MVAFATMLTLPFSYVVSYGSELFFGVLSNPMLLELIQCSKSFWTGIAFIVLGFVVVHPIIFLKLPLFLMFLFYVFVQVFPLYIGLHTI